LLNGVFGQASAYSTAADASESAATLEIQLIKRSS